MNAVKIYFGKQLLLITKSEEAENVPGEVVLHDPSYTEISNLVVQLQSGSIVNAAITSGDPDSILNPVKDHFKIIQAGGGIVVNSNGEVLLIFRRGKWDLPKGKLDDGETIEECALREVSEETGLTKITIGKFIMITRHVYEEKDQLILKETHWFRMHYHGNEPLLPQAEEDIEKAVWVASDELTPYLENTFPSIEEILKEWRDKTDAV